MARISAVLLAIVVLFGAVEVMAAEKDKDKDKDRNVFVCALSRTVECVSDEGCVETTVQEMVLPRFVRIDLNAKSITSLDKEVDRTTRISSVERLNGLIVLHGTEQRGWSVAIGENSGNVTLTASGDGDGFVVFGSCINP
ncbi:hypothetical protein [Geobacter sp. SVR]|uniref:hypothetical protein n=1 Tax=Geobacter sp. SVR TaxID=2495594 RepID=UPI00143F0412|nr:hypothetical protein [Geobacter sp. SVR]BCS52873.1 hypothetical protein GSVR_11810 [Geobacter sp. SVR]GCF87496.1 hypothetical protein GSbR_40960 [Geobacter sp. SVR]